jgi:hypothetical protein
MTHGGLYEITVVKNGQNYTLQDYGSYAPISVWQIERLISGMAAESWWESEQTSNNCRLKP